MSDIYCRICGEPYMEPRLDMTKWEYELFMRGAGCPCCQGVPPDGKRWEPKTDEEIRMAAANGDGCPLERLDLYEPTYTPPKWERPKPEILWTCAGCGVTVIVNPDNDELEYDLPSGANGAGWYHSHPYDRGLPEREPHHVFEPGQPVCEFCYSECDGCGTPVCSLLEYSDCYDDGWCSTLEAYGCRDVYCIGCVESTCSVCGSLPDDCTCCADCGKSSDDCECYCGDCGELKNECACFEDQSGDEEEDDA